MIHNITDELIDFLNSIAKTDSQALLSIINFRVPCTDTLADHPTVQVGSSKNHNNLVGMLGILNGFCGVFDDGPFKGYGPITAELIAGEGGIRFRRTDRPIHKSQTETTNEPSI